MRFMEKLEDYVFWAVTTGVAALAAGAWWVLRVVFTNQQSIELLTHEIKHRDQLRREDREALSEVRSDVKEIRDWIVERKG